MKKLTTLTIIILLFIVGCTSLIIVGKHNSQQSGQEIETDSKLKLDSIDILDRSKKTTTTTNDTIR